MPANTHKTAASPVATGLLSMTPKAIWSDSSPKKLRDSPLNTVSWPAWVDYFESRKEADGLSSLREAKNHAVSWGVDPNDDPYLQWMANLTASLTSKSTDSALADDVTRWIAEASNREVTSAFGLECLAWAYSLDRLSKKITVKLWSELCDALLNIALEADQARIDIEQDSPESAWAQQLLAGELPLALGCVIPEVKPFLDLRPAARNTLSDALVDWTDGEGLFHSRLLPCAAPIIACWTRCRTLGENLSKNAWNSIAENQYEWLVRQALRLVDRDGVFPLCGESTPIGMNEVFQAALDLAGDESDYAAAALRLRRVKVHESKTQEPEPSNQSDWAGMAILGAGWRDKSPRLFVTHEDDVLRFELQNNRRRIFSGSWPVDITIDGQAIKPEDEWECTCWYSDEDCDYLELAIDLEQGGMLERQFLLARQDDVAMLGELLFTKETAAKSLKAVSRFPLCDKIKFEGEEETNDGWLNEEGKCVAGVLPLALPEWRVETRDGDLGSQDEKQLVLEYEAKGRNLSSPLWIDLSGSRFDKQHTWRRLTVAQSLQRVANDVAVGFRIQAGKQQWIAYRSLDPAANRTVLGQNLSSEALVGRFLRTGEVDEYFEIEADDED